MKQNRFVRLLIPLIFLAWPAAAGASFVEDLSIAELTARSSAVVHGRVIRVESAWDETHTRIYTTVQLEVISYLAGDGPRVVTIRQVGGRVGSTELRVEGQPTFDPDERVVVFLEPDAERQDRWIVVSMAAGKFTVTTNTVTGELVLSRDLSGLDLVRLTPEGMRPVRRARRAARPLLLRELVEEVRRAARQGGQP